MPNLFNLFQQGSLYRVKTLLGYSNAIVPSIFSGRYPSEHNVWAIFKMSPKTSPFRVPKIIPKSIIDKSSIARYFINKNVFNTCKKRGLLPGYFETINIPLRLLKYFDVSMKKHITEPNSLDGTATLFDLMRQKGIPFEYVGYPWYEETKQIFDQITKLIMKTNVVVGYVGEVDHNGHKSGVHSKKFLEQLKSFDELCAEFLRNIMQKEKVGITIFSDHGMEDVNGTVNLQNILNSTDLKIEKDYLLFLDSTIARFWPLNNNARNVLTDVLSNTKGGHVLSQDEIEKYKINFTSKKTYGELFYLTDVGKVILPNFYSILNGSITAMHGWDPNDSTQDCMLFTNQKSEITSFEDVTRIFYLMKEILNLR